MGSRLWLRGINLNLRTCKGQSGSPFFYCPYGDDSTCGVLADAETPWVYAVLSGYNTAESRVMGPKVPYFRDCAIAFMGD
jgi:hypothetical protein